MVKKKKGNDDLQIDDLLDDEGWDLLNSLTEEELQQLNNDFDPENALVPVQDRSDYQSVNSKPMFNKEDLVEGLEKMVENSRTVFKNDKIRRKEEEKKAVHEEKLKKKFSKVPPKVEMPRQIALTAEEEELLNDATEEELIEAAALLKMNGVLTSEQIQSVWAGDKPKGSLKTTSVKATAINKEARISRKDEETELDVVELMKCLKEDSDSLFYLCINNEPKLEKKVKDSLIKAVETSKKIRHVSFAMIGLIDHEIKQLAQAIRFNDKIETINLESNVITQHGLTPLMKEIARHPSIREVKISNQKQPFGGNGEECMATAIDQNENILKFGYSFQHAGPRNKADRAIIRHNETLRQKRRNGEVVYDLKAVCKKRDPWPQPWIKVKSQRGLGGLIASKASEIGNRLDEEVEGKETDSRPKMPGAMNINALLSQRKSKLKGCNIEELEAEQERKRKQQFKDMHESEKAMDENSNKPVEPVKPPEPKKPSVKVAELNKKEEKMTFANKRRSMKFDADEALPDFSEFEDEEKARLQAEQKAQEEADRITREEAEEKRKIEEELERKRKEKEEAEEAERIRVANLIKIKPLNKKEDKLTFANRRRSRKFDDDDEEAVIDFGTFETEESQQEADQLVPTEESSREEEPKAEELTTNEEDKEANERNSEEHHIDTEAKGNVVEELQENEKAEDQDDVNERERKEESNVGEQKEEREAEEDEEEAQNKADEAEQQRIEVEEENKRRAEEETKKKVEQESKQKAEEEEAKKKAEEDAKKKAEEEAEKKAEEESKKKAEEEAKKKAEEESKKKAEEEAKKKAEEESKKKAEEEAKKKAEEEAKKKAEEVEAKRKQEEEDKKKKEEAEPNVDIFGSQDDDSGEPKKLSLRERMARRGR